MQSGNQSVTYTPAGLVVQDFMNDPSFVRGIMGPIGSGKSTACVIEILKRAAMQAPHPRDGIRYTRWAIIRNSYPELKSTTIKTWAQWCPLHYGKLNQDSPITHHIKTPELDIEVLFMALDREEDVKKLLSLEITGAWVNEAREVPRAIIDALTGRVGRFPAKVDGGATWSGVIMDTNPPDDQSWWYNFAEEALPAEWRFFKQPSGISPEAENLQNLPDRYYDRIRAGKSEDWIKVYVRGEYGYVIEGKAVFPEYKDSTHCSQTALEPDPALALEIGVDFGLTPAAVIGQKMVDGRWRILDEVTTDNTGVRRFAELLSQYMARHYPDFDVAHGWGDPAGTRRGQENEEKSLEIMAEYTGWKWLPAPSNEPMMRQEAVKGALNRLIDGEPGFLLSPKCKMVRKGFTGGYHFKSVKTGNGTQYHEEPAKNAYSHPHDALQYLLLGGGEADVVMNKVKRTKRRQGGDGRARVAQGTDYEIFGR
jgi:hypothetical protein